jgi:inner membrane protein
MTKSGHQLTGIGAALAAIGLITLIDPIFSNPLLTGFVAFFGATAPDWLEIPLGWNGRQRLSVLPHRTWTHWWPLWLLGTAYGLGWITRTPHPLWLAFCIGGWWHLVLDAPNPMGLPVWTPYQRKSLSWWKSSERIPELVLLSLGTGFALLSLPALFVR